MLKSKQFILKFLLEKLLLPVKLLVLVSLYDSLDDTGEEDRRRDSAGSLDRGNKCVI